MTGFSEYRRQSLHVTMASFALLLRVLTWWQAALCAVAAFLFNLLVLPRIGGAALNRPGDAARGYPLGILFYPLSVLLLILAFPRRLDIVAAAWGILAFGDGAATIVGTRFRSRALPWNPDKSVGGSLAFVVAGGLAGAGLCLWTRPAISPLPPLAFALGAPALAAVAAAGVESMRIRLDDNISVPIAAAIVLGGLALVDGPSLAAARSWLPHALLLATLVNVPIATARVAGRQRDDRRRDRRCPDRDRGVRVRRLDRVGAAVHLVPGRHRVDAAGPQAEVGARHRGGPRRPPGARQRDCEHRPRRVRRNPGRALSPPRRRAAGDGDRARRGRERHRGKRDWQGLGHTNLSVPDCSRG